MLIFHNVTLNGITWDGFIATIILVSSIIFTTLFYVAWKKYRDEKESDRNKKIDVDKNDN